MLLTQKDEPNTWRDRKEVTEQDVEMTSELRYPSQNHTAAYLAIGY